MSLPCINTVSQDVYLQNAKPAVTFTGDLLMYSEQVTCISQRVYRRTSPALVYARRTDSLDSSQGHVNTSFHVQCVWSPDDSHVLSGSCDANAYIWDVKNPTVPWMLRVSFRMRLGACSEPPCGARRVIRAT